MLDLTVKLTKMEHSAQGKKIRGARCKMSKHLGADAKLPFFFLETQRFAGHTARGTVSITNEMLFSSRSESL